MNYSYTPEFADLEVFNSNLFLRPQLPIPDDFYNRCTIVNIKSAFCSGYKPFEEDERRFIESFIANSQLMYYQSPADFGFDQNNKPYEVTTMPKSLNDVSMSLFKAAHLSEPHESSTEVHSPSANKRQEIFSKNLSLKEDSDSAFGGDSKVPTKESLYKLSMMIQNTNPDFENFLSTELALCVDACYKTMDGLYVSKNICGFDWSFEIFFEKARETNRNRRQLRCKHNECNKVFKKAWNLFDHMRIHTGEKPFICQQCGRSFAQNGNLTKHMKLHLKKDRKVHDCRVCGKKYTEKFNLRVHMKKHKLVSAEKPATLFTHCYLDVSQSVKA